MSDNGRVTFDEATHTYRVRGVEIPGVSTVLALAGLEPAFTVDPVTLALAAQRGTWNGKPAIVDLKTGKELRWTMGVQLAGYAIAAMATHPREPAYARVLVHLRADGSYRHYAHDETASRDYLASSDYVTFESALHIAHRKLARPRTKLPLVAPETGDVEVA